ALLDESYALSRDDVTLGESSISIEATLGEGGSVSLSDRNGGPPLVHFPAARRAHELLGSSADLPSAALVHDLVHQALTREPAPRVALVRALEACAQQTTGVVFSIEEPELFLAPQAHRYMYRLIRRLAERGNQVFFTTHAPGLLSVAS